MNRSTENSILQPPANTEAANVWKETKLRLFHGMEPIGDLCDITKGQYPALYVVAHNFTSCR